MLKIDHWAARSFELLVVLLLVLFFALFPGLGRRAGFFLLKPLELLSSLHRNPAGSPPACPPMGGEELDLSSRVESFLEEERKKAVPPLKERVKSLLEVTVLEEREGELWIDGGLRDGVDRGDPFLYGTSLAGIVSETEEERSKVLTLLSPSFRVSACIKERESGDACSFILQGTGKGGLDVEYPMGRSEPKAGALVITEGYEKKVPKGLLLGRFHRNDPRERFFVKPFLFPGALGHGVVLLSRKDKDPSRRKAENWKEVTARILLSGDTDPFRHSICIDAGEDCGLKRGCSVVAGKSLIGVVSSLGRSLSRVTLLGDPSISLKVFALEERGRVRKIFGRGRGGKGIRFAREGAKKVGDGGQEEISVFFTAFGSHPIPPGLLVGEVRAREDGYEVDSFYDPSLLRVVKVLVPAF